MALQLPDPNVTVTSNDKTVHQKTVRIPGTGFSLPGSAVVLAALPSDASILSIRFYSKTKPAGGGVTAATVSIGIPGAPTQFVSAYDVLTPATGAFALVTPVTNIMQNNVASPGVDIPLLFTATATTGAPTSGEVFFTIEYIR